MRKGAAPHRSLSGRALTVALISLYLLFTLIAALVSIHKLIPTPKEILALVKSQLEFGTGAKAHIGGVSGSPLKSIILQDVRIGDDELSPTGAVFSCERVEIKLNPLALLSKRRMQSDLIRQIVLHSPTLHLHRDESGVWNFQRAFKPRKPARPPTFTIRAFAIDGCLLYEDEMVKLPSGRALKLSLHRVRAKMAFHPAYKPTIGSPQEGMLTWEMTGIGDNHIMRRISTSGAVSQSGRLQAQFKIAAHSVTPHDLPTELAKAIQSRLGWLAGKASVRLTADVRRDGRGARTRMRLKAAFEMQQPSIAIKGVAEKPFQAIGIVGSAHAISHGRKLLKGNVVGHAAGVRGQFDRAHFEVTYEGAQLCSRITLHGANMMWLRERFGKIPLPYELDVTSGWIDRVDISLKRPCGKPTGIDARIIASNLIFSAPLLKRAVCSPKLDLQCHLLSAPMRAPIGHVTLNASVMPEDGAPSASISARINLWRNFISGDAAVANMSAKALNMLQEHLLPFSDGLTGGLLNCSFSFRMAKGERKGWLDSRIELSDVTVRQLRVKGLPQWDELFPDGVDLKRVYGLVRYNDGMWQIVGIGFSHRDFDAAIEGAISRNPLAFRVAGELFGVDFSSVWRAIKRLLPRDSPYRKLDVDAVAKGQLNLRLFGTGKMLTGGIEIDAPTVHLHGEGIGTASILPTRSSVQLAYIHDKPPRIAARISSQEITTGEVRLGADEQADIERFEISSPIELLGMMRMSKVTLQLGDGVRAHSSVNVKLMRLGKLMLRDVHFEVDAHGGLVELSNIEGKLDGGAVRNGSAAIEHIGWKELKRADFACTVEQIAVAHALSSLGNAVLPPSVSVGGASSGKLSISLNGARVDATYIGKVEAPMLTYKAPDDASETVKESMTISSVNASGNTAHLQVHFEFARVKDSYKLTEGTLAASLDRGRTRLTLSDDRLVDAPLRDAFVRAKFDRDGADITDAQCILWDAKLRGWMKCGLRKDELHAQVLFSELNLNELEEFVKERIAGRADGLITLAKERSMQQLTARLNACNLLLPIRMSGSEPEHNERHETKLLRVPYVSASIGWDGKRLNVKSAKVHYADAEFTISGSVEGLDEGLKKAEVDLKAFATAVDIGRALSGLGVEVDFEGVGNIDAHITGAIAAPKVEALVSVPLPLIAGVAFERLDGNMVYDAASKAVTASPLRFKLGGSEVTITASVEDIFKSQRLRGKVTASKLQLVWLMRQVAPKVRVDGFISTAGGIISGTLTNPSLDMNFRVADAKLYGTEVGSGNGRAMFSSLGRKAHSIKAQLVMKPQHGSATLDLSLTRVGKKLSVNVRCSGEQLQLAWVEALLSSLNASLKAMEKKAPELEQAVEIASKLPHPLSGMLRFTANYAGGDDGQRWQIECAIPKLHMRQIGPYELRARLHGDESQRRIEELHIAHAGAVASCSGVVEKDGNIRLEASLQKLPLSSLSHFPKLRLPVDAIVTANILIHGSLGEPKLSITGEATDIRYRDLHIDGARFKSVRYESEKLFAGRGELIIHQAGHSMLLWGKLPIRLKERPMREELDVHMQLIGAPITLWRSFSMPVDDTSVGHFNIDLHLTGTWELPMLHGELDISSPKLCLMGGRMTLTDVNVSAIAEGRRIKVEQCSANWGGGKVSIDGHIGLGKDALSSPMANDIVLDIRANDVPLALGRSISIGKLNVLGRLQSSSDGDGPFLQLVSASLADQPQAFRADGFAQWHSGLWDSWDSLKPSQLRNRLMLARCNFNLSLNKLHLRLRDAFDGYVSGSLRLVNQEPSPEEPSLDKLAAVDGKLKRYMPAGIPTLTGAVTVHNGTMRGIPRLEARPHLKPIKLALPKIAVTLRLGSDVELRNVQISAPLRGQVSINGYPNRLNVVGKLYADRGTLRLPGGVLRLVTADIQVNATSGGEVGTAQGFANLNFEARGRVGNYEVTMYASGPLGGAEGVKWATVKFASTPPLTESEIARRLLGINLPKELASEDAYEALVETITPTLQRAFASTVGGGLAQALGLEQITFEQVEGGAQRLGIGARISPNLYIRWYHGLAGQGNVIEVEQWLSRWISFVWRRDERQRNEFRMQVHFQF